MLKSKIEKTVEILAGPGETVSGARIIAFESGVRLVTGDIGWGGKHDEPLSTTFWESYKARQIAYALLLAADASDHARADIDEIKRREVDRETRKIRVGDDLGDLRTLVDQMDRQPVTAVEGTDPLLQVDRRSLS